MAPTYCILATQDKEFISLGEKGVRPDAEYSGPEYFQDGHAYWLSPDLLTALVSRFRDAHSAASIVIGPTSEVLDTDQHLDPDDVPIEVGGERDFDVPLTQYLPELREARVGFELVEIPGRSVTNVVHASLAVRDAFEQLVEEQKRLLNDGKPRSDRVAKLVEAASANGELERRLGHLRGVIVDALAVPADADLTATAQLERLRGEMEDALRVRRQRRDERPENASGPATTTTGSDEKTGSEHLERLQALYRKEEVELVVQRVRQDPEQRDRFKELAETIGEALVKLTSL